VVHAPTRNRPQVPGAVRHAGSAMLTVALSARRLLPLRHQGLAVIVGDAIRVILLSQQRPPLLGPAHTTSPITSPINQGVQVGMEVHQVPIGLDGDDDAGNGGRVLARRTEEDLQGIDSALAELPEEPAISSELHPEHFGDGKDVLPMRDGSQDLFGHPASELKHPLLVTGGAEVAPFVPLSAGFPLCSNTKANRYSCRQVSHRTRANPLVRSPQPRNFSTTRPMTGR